MHISVYVLFIFTLTSVHADPDVEYGKPSEGSYADTRLRRNSGIVKEQLQRIERFVEFRKRLKQSEKERQSSDSRDNHGEIRVHENDGRQPASDIDKEHLQKLERFVEFRKRLKQRQKRQAPGSEEKPVYENGGSIHIDKEHLHKIKRILELRKRLNPRAKEMQTPDSNVNNEENQIGENGGRPSDNDIDKEHLQKIKRILELRKPLKQREKERQAPYSNTNHEKKSAGDNSGRPPGIVEQTTVIQEGDSDGNHEEQQVAAHRNNGSPEGISVVPPPEETSLLADKALWICVAVYSGVCFVMVVLCCCFYKCLVLIRSHHGKTRSDDQRSDEVINVTGNDEIGSGWGSEEEEVFNVSDYKRERGSPSVSRTKLLTYTPISILSLAVSKPCID